MGDIEDFFNFTKKFERRTVTGGTVGGRTKESEWNTKVEPRRVIPETTDYARKYEKELERDLRLVSRNLIRKE